MSGNDANTLLLLHCDGTDASTSFPDVSPSARTVTAVGNAQVDTAQSVFGGASALFDGTGDYLSVPDSSDWAFGSGDFTFDMQARFSSLAATRGLFGQATTNVNNTLRAYVSTAGAVFFNLRTAGVDTVLASSASGAVVINTFYHMAFVRNGTDWSIYLDGVSIASATVSASVADYTGVLRFGADGTSGVQMAGWLDEIRVSNIARWTSGFTPPTAEYDVDAGGQPTVKRFGGVPFASPNRGVW